MTNKITIAVDGSCIGNPGPGGWAAVIVNGQQENIISGGETETTNNRMELTAAIEALNSFTKPTIMTVLTDSNYVKNGIQQWVKKWQNNNWRTANKKPVLNVDLWKKLITATNKHEITWEWVKGHSGHPLNEKADAAANSAARNQQLTL